MGDTRFVLARETHWLKRKLVGVTLIVSAVSEVLAVCCSPVFRAYKR